MVLILFLLGLIVGSFLNVLIYRLPLGKSILGRSFCPKCKSKIDLYDNIPLLSYILLNGKCRNCGKRISSRYFIIELLTGIIFVLVLYFFNQCRLGFCDQGILYCTWLNRIGFWTIPYFLLIASLLIVIVYVDIKYMLIPDSLSFILILVTFILLVFSNTDVIWMNLFAGFASSLFLYSLNLITKGRGMGLGDVKLALFMGMFMGPARSFIWLFLAFILGSVVGIILVFLGKAGFKAKIPFGPFLVASFIISLFINPNFLFFFGL